MSVQLSKTLYIRVEPLLRADLLTAAEAAGQSVSAFARGILRGTISQGAERAAAGERVVSLRPSRASDTGGAAPRLFRGVIRQAKDGDA